MRTGAGWVGTDCRDASPTTEKLLCRRENVKHKHLLFIFVVGFVFLSERDEFLADFLVKSGFNFFLALHAGTERVADYARARERKFRARLMTNPNQHSLDGRDRGFDDCHDFTDDRAPDRNAVRLNHHRDITPNQFRRIEVFGFRE